jgi:hypothetical protein
MICCINTCVCLLVLVLNLVLQAYVQLYLVSRLEAPYHASTTRTKFST